MEKLGSKTIWVQTMSRWVVLLICFQCDPENSQCLVETNLPRPDLWQGLYEFTGGYLIVSCCLIVSNFDESMCIYHVLYV